MVKFFCVWMCSVLLLGSLFVMLLVLLVFVVDFMLVVEVFGLQLCVGSLMLIFVLVMVQCGQGSGIIVCVDIVLQVEGEVVQWVVIQFVDLLVCSGGLCFMFVQGKVVGKLGSICFEIILIFCDSGESYMLESIVQGVVVQVGNEIGLFYGVIIFVQFVIGGSNGVLLVVQIQDVLCFSWCGFMFDLVWYFQSLDEIKCVFDVMVVYKFNIFYWYLIDDQGWCMEIKCYLKLIDVGSCCLLVGDGGVDLVIGQEYLYCGFYMQEQICEVIVYVVKLYIQVILEIDVLGYVIVVIVVYLELGLINILLKLISEWGVFLNLFNVEDSIVIFFENVLEEVIVLFLVKYVYVGGDEVVKDQWEVFRQVQQCMCVLGIKDEMVMQSYIIKCLEIFLEEYDWCLIGWDEIFEGGLLLQVMVMLWQGIEGGLVVVCVGYDVVMLLVGYLYLDYLQMVLLNEFFGCLIQVNFGKLYNFEFVLVELVDDKCQYIFGLQVNMFIEYMCIYVCLQYNLFLCLVVVVEIGWSMLEYCDFCDFFVCLFVQL